MIVSFIIIVLINTQLGSAQLSEPLFLEVSNSFFGISQEDIKLVMQNNKKGLNERLDYLIKTDPEQYEKLIKYINYYEINNDLLNKYVLSKKCADSIVRRHYSEAADTLKSISLKNYGEVVNQAYRNDTDYFMRIIQFGKFIYKKNENKSLVVCEELLKLSKEHESSETLLNMLEFVDECYNSSEYIDFKNNILDAIYQSFIKKNLTITRYNLYWIEKVYNSDTLTGIKLITTGTANSLYNIGSYHTNNFLSSLSVISNSSFKIEALKAAYLYYDRHFLMPLESTLDVLEGYMKEIFFENKSNQYLKNKLLNIADSLSEDIKSSNSSPKCIQNKASSNYLKAPYKADQPVYLSPFEQAYNRTKWILVKHNLFYYYLLNAHSNSVLNKRDLIDATVEVEADDGILCMINDRSYSQYFSIEVEPNGYLRDDEGFLEIGDDSDDFAQWRITSC